MLRPVAGAWPELAGAFSILLYLFCAPATAPAIQWPELNWETIPFLRFVLFWSI